MRCGGPLPNGRGSEGRFQGIALLKPAGNLKLNVAEFS